VRPGTLVAVGLLGAAAVGAHFAWRRDVPELPEVELASAEPPAVRAIQKAREGVERAPRSAAAWGRLGLVLLVFDYHPEATQCLACAERLDPNDPRWPFLQVSWRAANDPEAIAGLERALALAEEAAEVRLRVADALAAQGRHDDADAHYRRVLERQPSDPRAALGLGRLAVERGRFDEALQHLERARTSPLTRKSACLVVAEAHQALGDPAAAADAARQVRGLPDDQPPPPPYFAGELAQLQADKDALGLPQRLLTQGRLPQALARLEQLAAAYPDWAEAWLQLGQAHVIAGNAAAGERALRRGADIAPDAARSQYVLGAGLWYLGKPMEAAVCLRRALELQPNYAEAHYHLSLCLERQGDQTGAVEALRTALGHHPTYVEARLALGKNLAREGRPAEALEQVRAAAQLRPGDEKIKQALQELEQSAARER
jgi:tetratricopeptide (TPR) repeat protein